MRSLSAIERERDELLEEMRRTRRLRVFLEAVLTVALLMGIVACCTVQTGTERTWPTLKVPVVKIELPGRKPPERKNAE